MAKETERTEMIHLTRQESDTSGKDLYVSVNNRDYLIQYEVDVEVPWFVAEVIRNSRNQEKLARSKTPQA